MLITTDPLGQLALDCGIGDQAHFQFRRQTLAAHESVLGRMMMAVALLSSRRGFLASSAATAHSGMFHMLHLPAKSARCVLSASLRVSVGGGPIQEINYVSRRWSYHRC
jgi:hypothetical protein